MEPTTWTCPFCNRPTTITNSDVHESATLMNIANDYGPVWLEIDFKVCPNPECKKYSLKVTTFSCYRDRTDLKIKPKSEIQSWSLVPPSQAKTFPSYVPKPIIQDYEEACLIKDLSPKASATLARRCLQGIVRDFWKVKGENLNQEIKIIEDKIDPLVWKAIDSTRSIGNIGAHMEKDINVIIDVDPEEANRLIWLIEYLIEQWYIGDHEKKEKLKTLNKIAKEKEKQKKVGKKKKN